MKFYVEEIAVHKDGTSAHAITEKETKEKALSDYHLAMAYAYLNADLVSFHCEAKDEQGTIFKTDTFVNEPEEEAITEKE